jgi:hypothetical protein
MSQSGPEGTQEGGECGRPEVGRHRGCGGMDRVSPLSGSATRAWRSRQDQRLTAPGSPIRTLPRRSGSPERLLPDMRRIIRLRGEGAARWGLGLQDKAHSRALSARELSLEESANGRGFLLIHREVSSCISLEPGRPSQQEPAQGGRGWPSGRGPLRGRPRGVYRANSPDGAAGGRPRELRTSPDNLLMDGADNRKAGRREGRSGAGIGARAASDRVAPLSGMAEPPLRPEPRCMSR